MLTQFILSSEVKLFEGWRSNELARLPLKRIAIDELSTAGSPRTSGHNLEHVGILAVAGDALPPILVHRLTMRVLDGVHRVHAARLRGADEIEARLFDGDVASSFVLAVQANSMHGLPLSLGDRKAASTRILEYYPHWSDRAVASVTGLAHQTVAKMRRSMASSGDLNSRVGRDGRYRPRDSVSRREHVRKMLADNPDASLRAIAQEVHVSPETVRGIRAALTTNATEEISTSHEAACSGADPAVIDKTSVQGLNSVDGLHLDATIVWRALRADPAFRSTETGRFLLRMLSAYQMLEAEREDIILQIPPHCIEWVVKGAQACARAWHDFAQRAEQQASLSQQP